jgi:hypothetical protein
MDPNYESQRESAKEAKSAADGKKDMISSTGTSFMFFQTRWL